MKCFSVVSLKNVGLTVIALLFLGVTFLAGLDALWDEQWSQYQSIRNISCVVFVVVGLWMKTIYSSGLKHAQFDRGACKRVELLHFAMIRSGAIIAVVSAVEWFAPHVRGWSKLIPEAALNNCTFAVQGASYALLSTLLVVQLRDICVALVPNFAALSDLRAIIRHQERRS